MSIDHIIFPDSLPRLDLHGYDRESARVAITDFVRDSFKQKNEFVIIIHGVGSGIIRQTTLVTLKTCKNVVDFKLLNHNYGCTIVQIKV